MARKMERSGIKPQVVEVGSKKIVIMDEQDYDRLLDIIDAAEAERIALDESDPVLGWDQIKDELITNRIAEKRKAAGMTQRELASRLSVKQSTVSRMEKNNSNLTISTLRKIAEALGCQVHELIA